MPKQRFIFSRSSADAASSEDVSARLSGAGVKVLDVGSRHVFVQADDLSKLAPIYG